MRAPLPGKRTGLWVAIGLSALVHAAAVLAFGLVPEAEPLQVRFEEARQSVEATFLPVAPPAPPPPPEPPPAPPPVVRPEIIRAEEAPVTVPEPPPPPEEPPPPEPQEPEPVKETPPEPVEAEAPPEPAAPVPPSLAEEAPPEETEPAEEAPDLQGVRDPAPSPAPQYCPAPRYPAQARREGREGVVVLDLEIDRRGRVLACVLRESSGHDDLDERALSTARRWRFEPPAGSTFPYTFPTAITFRLE